MDDIPKGMKLAQEGRCMSAINFDEVKRKATNELSPLDRLRGLSGTHQIDEMRSMLRNAKYVVPGMVMTGTCSQFYAWPNGGKTLFIMSQLRLQIEAGNIRGQDIFYVNEDDNFEGFLTKCEIARSYGFTMLSSKRSKDDEVRDPRDILKLIIAAADSGDVDGMVFIFDTMKNFVSVMDKSVAPAFFSALRRITANNGTVILLGHANKNLGPEGELIYEGVGDIKADIDIQYAIYNLSDRKDERQVLKFVNMKDRGRCEMERVVEYTKAPELTYLEMLDSVRTVDGDGVKRQEAQRRREAIRDKYFLEVPFIHHALADGDKKKTQIVRLWSDTKSNCELAGAVSGRNMLVKAIEGLEGVDICVNRGDRGAKGLSLIESGADRYRRGKDDE